MSLRVRLLFNFPTYKILAVSIVSIIVGVASIILSVVGLINRIWGYYVAPGIWSGSLIVLCGIFGIISSQTRGVCVVKTFMILAILSCLASIGMVALSCGGVIYESHFFSDVFSHHPNTQIIYGLLLGTGTIQTVLSLLCAIVCIRHVCCKPKPKRSSASFEPANGGNDFQRGGVRESQSSSAPLLSRRPKASASNDREAAGPSTSQNHSDSDGHNTREKDRRRKKRPRSKEKPEHDSRKLERKNSPGESGHSVDARGRGRRKSPERERPHSSERRRSQERNQTQHSSLRNKSPDRYANKPTCSHAAQSEESLDIDHAALVVAMNLEQQNDNNESLDHLILNNDLDGLPPYEEVIADNSLDHYTPRTNENGNKKSNSKSSMDSIDRLENERDTTHLKETSAEQEALLCLSAAIQSPVNSGISNILSDPFVAACNLSSLSENSFDGTDHTRKLSTDLVIKSQNNSEDDAVAPSITAQERQALIQKYNASDPDPQGVIYKEFTRRSDIIKDTIDSKPKRSQSFQHSRERQFARGKSISSRHLSCDKNQDEIDDNITSEKSDAVVPFRVTSKSFSKTPGAPGKPPPKPPRTSSLKQIGNKERPKSATLPYSQFAAMVLLDDDNSQTNKQDQPNTSMTDDLQSFKPRKIEGPKFRYPRAKLSSETFKKPEQTEPSHNITSSRDGTTQKPDSPNRPQQLNLSNSSTNDIPHYVTSPLKSPTDYSAIPLKDILLKGQENGAAKRPDINLSSGSSSENVSGSSSANEAEDGARAAENLAGDRDSQNLSDTEGKPMYSFLL